MSKLSSNNYLRLKHVPLTQTSYRLGTEIFNKIEAFARDSQSNRIDKLAYLIRLFEAVKPTVSTVPLDSLSKQPRPHRAGSYLPEDASNIVKAFASKHNLSLTISLDVIIVEALKLSKDYSLDITLVKKSTNT